MAKEAKRGGKTETLTIRLDPKTRFILEFVARLKGQNITTVVERAIVSAANQETVEGQYPDQPDSWQAFWDISEGVRALKIAGRSEFFPTYEEDRRLAFAHEHWPFFFASLDKRRFINHYIDVLWPRIDEFIQIHDDRKQQDYNAAGKAMQDALRAAKLAAPEWPIEKPSVDYSRRGSRSLDDDVPF